MYSLEIRNQVSKDLKNIYRQYVPKIIKKIESLATQPRPQNVRKLVGSANTYRIRVGDYRIIYHIDDEI